MDTVIYFLYESQTMFFRSPYWSGKKDEKIKKIARLADQYFYNGLGQDFGGHPTMALRAIPIEKTIQDKQQILPYENVRQVVEREDYICVAHCPCRQRKNLDPDSLSCKHETRNCLHFGPMAHYQVEMGMAEVISRDEAMEILSKAADAGLVHAVSNTKTGPFDICNCCSCCCVFLQSANVLGLRGHQPSNYMIEVRIETCKGCGLCTERCPMKALSLETFPAAKNKEGKLAVLETEQCIGCGVCAHKCPTQSLKLVHRQGEHDFPEDMIDMAERMAKDRGRSLFG